MRIVHIVLLAILATLTVSLVAGAGHVNTPALSSITRVATAGPVAASSLTAVTRAATAGPINSSPIKGIARTATAGPVNSSPIKGIARTATAGPVGTSSLTAVTRTATAGPVGTDAMTAITRALVAGPIEDLIRAVVAATRGSGLSWWNLEHTFSDGNLRQLFGSSVSVDGDILVIGAEGSFDDKAGYVNQYRHNGTDWVLEHTFSDGNLRQLFGSSVSVDGDILVIGAEGSFDDKAGYVNQYRHNGTDWVLEHTFSDGNLRQLFGSSVSVDGDILVIGAEGSFDDKAGYVNQYRHNGTDWVLEHTFSDGNLRQLFGSSVSVDGDILVIGAEGSFDDKAGYVNQYRHNGTDWVLEHTFSDGNLRQLFGSSVSVDGDILVIGAEGSFDDKAGYVNQYRHNGTDWVLEHTFSDSNLRQLFGSSVSVDGNILVIGAQGSFDDKAGYVHQYRYIPPLGTCCVSDCGISVACYDDYDELDCLDLGGEWTEGALCADIICGPVQWTVEDGGNGHWYQLVEKVGGWNACRDAAIAVGGDLCSHDTQLEDEFISYLVPLEEPGIAWNRVYTGATQAEGSSPAEGWSWVDGSAWTDTNWHTGQPNGGEGHLSISNWIDEGFGWDDHAEDSSDINFYLIEWSADCNEDGIVDYGQILDGTLLDEDCDGVPDSCLASGTGACCVGGVCTDASTAEDCSNNLGLFFNQQYCADVEPCDTSLLVDAGGTDDPGAGLFTTIQGAIDYSHDGMTIEIMPGTYTGSGDSVITLPAHGITLHGIDGAGTTIIDGQDTRRGLIGDGCGDNGTVIEGLTFTNGFADGADGTYDGCGGGVSLSCCSPTFIDCVITKNHSEQNGGGVGINGLSCDPTFTDCEISWNTATGGGGIWIDEGDCGEPNGLQPMFDGCLINNNDATWTGGGFYISFIDVSMTDCRIISNTAAASSGGGGGGGVFMSGSATEFTGCMITGNMATQDSGGSITATFSELMMTDSVIQNSVAINGGGILLNASNANLSDCEFNNNTATEDGGGLRMDNSTATITNCNFASNTANLKGGGIFSADSDFTLTECTLASNEADTGGGFHLDSEGDIDVIGCRITGNEGGGIYIQFGPIDIGTSVICGNATIQISGSYSDLGGNYIEATCPPLGACCVGDCDATSICYDGVYDFECSELGGVFHHGQTCGNAGCGAVQWTIEDGGNGHWYLFYTMDQAWQLQTDEATSRGAHLVTLTSPEENAFVESIRDAYSGEDSAYIAGGEGGSEWTWVTGEAWDWTNWASGEPSGNIILGLRWQNNGKWEAINTTTEWYAVFEWSADCNDDGIVDYGQILDGTLLDDDCDGIPDSCQSLGACCIGDSCTSGLDEAGCTALSGIYFATDYCSGVDCSDIVTVDDDGLDNPDADYTSIQAAIDNSTSSVIAIYPGTYIANSESDVVVSMPPGRTLIGVGGAGATIIDGQGGDQGILLTDCSNAVTEPMTTLQGITFFNCRANDGAGIFCDSCDIHVVECLFHDNDAESFGGGIAGRYEADNTVRLTSCTFLDNEAHQGGGGWFNNNGGGSVTAIDCLFDLNIAHDRGAGLFFDNQPASEVNGCLFNQNTAGTNGGGLESVSSTTSLTDCLFTANSAGNEGGGLRATGAAVTMIGTVFEQNTAVSGGGVHSYDSDLTGDTCDFTDNTGTGSGGGLYNENNCTALLTDCTFTGNKCEGNDTGYGLGGGIRNLNCNQPDAIRLIDCYIAGNTAVDGGGFELDNSNVSLQGTTVCGNLPDQTHVSIGDDWNDLDGNVIRTSCDYVGAWVVDDDLLDEPLADFTDIQSAVDAASDGDEILVMPGSYGRCTLDKSLTIRGLQGQAEETIVSGSDDDIVFTITGEPASPIAVTLEHLTITDGYTTAFGGGIFADNCLLDVNHCLIYNNHSLNGGAALVRNGTYSFSDCRIWSNSAVDDGGGITFENCTGFVTGTRITSNNCSDVGGGLELRQSSSITIIDSAVCGNSPDQIFVEADSELIDAGGNIIESTCPPLGACCVGDCDATSICYDDLYDIECINLGGTFNDGQTCGDAGCGAVQWTVEDGGNGHWYQVADQYGCWTTHDALASTLGAHLATPTSEQENAFADLLIDTYTFIGLYQQDTSDEPAGGWAWVTGEPLDWTNWGLNEPNDETNPPSNFGEIWSGGGWNDVQDCVNQRPALYEWDADCDEDGTVDLEQIALGELADIDCNGIPDICLAPVNYGACCTGETCTDNVHVDDCIGFFYVDQPCALDEPCEMKLFVDDDGVNDPANGQFTTIQGAIDWSYDDMIISVMPGTYYETITLPAHGITLNGASSEGDPSLYVIDGEGARRGLTGDGCGDNGTVIRGLTFTNCRANDGGAINLNNCSPLIDQCAFIGNTADSDGGGIRTENCSPTISNCSFDNNTALSGGGVYNNNGSSPLIDQCTFTGNSATTSVPGGGGGGGMYINDGSSPTISNCDFSQNTSAEGGGGGIDGRDSTITLSNCTLTSNTTTGAGGGMYMFNCSLELTDCTVSGSSAGDSAAGIFSTGGAYVTMTRCTFSGNVATGPPGGGSGGAGHVDNTVLTIDECVFENNTGNAHGGALHIAECSSTFTNTTFTGNEIVGSGAALSISRGDATTLTNCTMEGNTAGEAGCVRLDDSAAEFINCTIRSNDGGGIRVENTGNDIHPGLTDTVVCGNYSGQQIDGGWTDHGGNIVQETCPPLGACCVGDCEATSVCYDDLWDFECSELGGTFNEGLSCLTADCGAVQWSVEDGGNGHWYAVVDTSTCWLEFQQQAEEVGGHLATISMSNENDFVQEVLQSSGHGYAYIGLIQDTDSPDYSEPDGGWGWITGEPLGWLNWGSSEPNDGTPPGLDNYGEMWIGGIWNDNKNCPTYAVWAIIEWEADIASPTGCEPDGIVDLEQIALGELADIDCNGIPDICLAPVGYGACCTGETCTDNVHVDDCIGFFYVDQPCAVVEPCEMKLFVDGNGVNDPAIGQFTSIQGAIDYSHDGFVINIMPGTYTGTGDSVITLPAHGITLNGASSGGDPSLYVIDGEGVRRGLTGDGCGDNGTIIQGLTFQNGYADNGGGIKLVDCSPAFSDCQIIDNEAVISGGGLHVVDSSLELTNCTVSANTTETSHGGGLFGSGGQFTMTGCTFSSNVSNGPPGGGSGGAGEFANDATISIVDCIFENNTGRDSGGALHTGNCTITFTNTTFTGNVVEMAGAALSLSTGTYTLTNCTIDDNNAGSFAGGVRVDNCSPIFDGCTIRNNGASEGGGGIDVSVDGLPVLIDTVVCGNGGDSQINVPWDDQGGNTIRNNCDYWVVDDNGLDDPNADFDNIQEAVDAASDGDEIRVMPGTYNENLEIVNSAVHLSGAGSDQTTIDGGGLAPVILAQGVESIHLSGLRISNGYQPSDQVTGGGISARDLSALNIEDCLIEGNQSEYQGGGLCAKDVTMTTVRRTTFMSNIAGPGGGCCGSAGGAVAIRGTVTCSEAGSALFEECLFIDNQAVTDGSLEGTGGAIAFCTDWVTSAMTIDTCHFEGNFAEANGSCLAIVGTCDSTTNYVQIMNSSLLAGSAPAPTIGGREDGTDVALSISGTTICQDSAGTIVALPFSDLGGNYIANECLPDAGNGACCVGGTCSPNLTAEECAALLGFFFLDDLCGDVESCSTKLVVDAAGTDDPNAGLFTTIQGAIDYSHDGFVINIMPGTYTGDGDSVITLPAHGITISGASSEGDPSLYVIDGEGVRRGLTGIGCGDNGTVIQGLTFANGYADNGGGVYLNGCSPTFNDCDFISNYSTSAPGDTGGGGLHADNSSPVITDCRFIGNQAVSAAGGVFAKSSSLLEMYNCTFENNTANGASAVYLCLSSSGNFDACHFTNNTATDGGGAANLNGSSATFTNSTFTGNSAASYGGAVTSTRGTTSIESCSFINNSAGTSGGALCRWNDELSITNTLICANTHEQIHGDYTDLGGNTIRTNCDYWVVDDLYDDDPNADFNNIQEAVDAAVNGDEIIVMPGTYVENIDYLSKALWIHGTEDGRDTTIIDGDQQDVTVKITQTADGTPAKLEHFTVQNGRSIEGGGIRIDGNDAEVHNCLITNNIAEEDGGGLFSYLASPLVTGCIIVGNQAGDDGELHRDGGGVYCREGNPRFENCDISSNEVFGGVDADGGGIFAYSAEITLVDCTITANTGARGGGASTEHGGDFAFVNCLISENTAGQIGGVYLHDSDSTATLESTTVCGNSTEQMSVGYELIGDGNYIADECLPDDGNGACCIGGTCSPNLTAEECAALLGFFFLDDLCGDIESCSTKLVVDAGGSDDPNAGLFTTIQGAIDYSHDGFVINIMPGTYTGDGDSVITLPAHGITLNGASSEGDSSLYVIDGEGVRRGLTGDGCGDTGTVIQGLTITNCNSTDGGGVLLNACDASLIDCIFLDNTADDHGGGLYGYDSNISCANCVFTNNTANFGGGALVNFGGFSSFTNCSFRNNTANGSGGGLYFDNGGDGSVESCIFENNHAIGNDVGWGIGGGLCVNGSNVSIAGSTIRNNTADGLQNPDAGDGGGLYFSGSDTYDLSIETTVICGNTPDQITGEPGNSAWIDLGGNTIRTNCDYWIVDDLFDDDPDADFDNIQAAVDAAIEAALDDDEILVMPGTYTSTSSAVVKTDGKLIWLRSAAGPDVTVIDGEDSRRGIHCPGGETSETTIDGFTITNGNATGPGIDGYGGGILCGNAGTNSSPTIVNCKLIDNNSDYGGGGMYAEDSNPTVISCIITGNEAGTHGGGIGCYGTDISIEDCTFEGNRAGGDGGGLRLTNHSTISITNCTFTGNEAQEYGGAIALRNSSTANLDDCEFTGNQALYGGAVGQLEGTSAATNCRFFNNMTTGDAETPGGGGDGGGYMASSGSIATFDDCVFSGNSSEWRGGGVSVHSGATVSLSNCEVRDNSANSSPGDLTGGGGLINTGGSLTLNGTIVCGNTPDQVGGQNGYTDNGGNYIADECLPDAGNGACCVGGTCSPNLTAEECAALLGFFFLDDLCGDVESCSTKLVVDAAGTDDPNAGLFTTIQGAIDYSHDGFVINIMPGTYTGTGDSAITLPAHGITLNGASSEGDSSLYVIDGEGVRRGLTGDGCGDNGTEIRGLTIQNGYADSGAGVHLNACSPTFVDCVITSNQCTLNGGGVYAQYCTPAFTNCIISSNTSGPDGADYGWGGGIYVWGENIGLTLNGCTIENNTARASFSGGIGFDDNSDTPGIVSITNCTISGNVSEGIGANGGGGTFFENAALALSGTIFSGNIAAGHGGGLYLLNSDSTMQDCDFTGNSAGNDGGAVCFVGSAGQLNECEVSGNETFNDGGGIACVSGSTVQLTNCLIELNQITGGATNAYGGGLYGYQSDIHLSGCEIRSNTSPAVGGGAYFHGGSSTVDTTVACGNTPDQISGTYADNGNNTIRTNCDYWIVDDLFDDDPDADFDNIQAAVDASVDGDEILVMPGTYTDDWSGYHTVLLNRDGTGGIDLWIHSSDGPEVTIIDGQGSLNGITINSQEGPETVIEGFTFQNCSKGANVTDGSDWSAPGPTFRSCIFTNCYQGAYTYKSPCTFDTCEFVNNTGINNGAGLTTIGGFTNAQPTILVDCIFDSNTAADREGGALHATDTVLELTRCTFTNNSAAEGGACYLNRLRSGSTFDDCSFTNNESVTKGGAFYCLGSTSTGDTYLSFANCDFTNNRTESQDVDGGVGGGIYFRETEPFLTSCSFTSNTAGYGAGIFAEWRARLHIDNCDFTNNTANRGGGVYIFGSDAGSLEITNSRFVSNSTEFIGAGVQGETVNTTISDCLFKDNISSAPESSPNAGLSLSNGWNAYVSYSTFCGNIPNEPQAWWTGEGNTFSAKCDPDEGNGSCCVADLEIVCITNIDVDACDAQNGIFYPGATCEQTTCPAVGTCCLGGSSDITFEADCPGQWYEGVDAPDYCTLGVCCLVDGTCIDTNQQECDPATGVFHEGEDCGSFTCPPHEGYGACCVGESCTDHVAAGDCIGDYFEQTLCIDTDCVTGACCLDDGTCIDGVTNSKCVGTFYAEQTCAEIDCTLGACCLPDGTCENTTGQECSGIFYAGESCFDVDCTLGACCLVDGTCIDTIAEDCSGVFHPGADCGSFTCPPHAGYGACCVGESCTDYVAAGDCIGDYFEQTLCIDTDCVTGACCLDDLTCIDGVTASKCLGQFTADATCFEVICRPPAGFGACCLTNGTCLDNITATDCGAYAGSQWHESLLCTEAPCPPTGACCTPLGGCSVTFEVDCPAPNYWLEGYTCDPNPCDPTGACCLPDGECVDDQTQGDCFALDGTQWTQGAACEDVDCPQPAYGACCYADGTCDEALLQLTCLKNGGTWHDGLTCVEADCPLPDPTGACCLGTFCIENWTEIQCAGTGGTWLGPDTDCTGDPCLPTGACCFEDGSCLEDQSQIECLKADGTWNVGMTCAEADCPLPGACCIGTTCIIKTKDDCADDGGTYYGDGSDCSNDPCAEPPAPLGGCCIGTECRVTTVVICTELGGDYLGDETDCSGDPCAEPRGACCDDGDCIYTTESICTDFGGEWHEGVTCEEDPLLCRIEWACCFGDNQCAIVEEYTCEVLLDGTWHDGQICSDDLECSPPTGACCLDSIYCLEAAEQETCDQFGGDWSKGTACADLDGCNETNIPLGSCCIDGDTCYDGIPEISCQGISGGSWLGEDSTCVLEGAGCVETITGACCLFNGNCADETLEGECVNFGGTWNKGLACADIDCPQPGACCRADGSCYVTLQEPCTSDGNTFWGEGTTCDPNPCPQPTGACCYDDGSCNENMELGECIAGGGDWNEGLTCFEADCPVPTGACCYDDGTCDEALLQQACLKNGGTWNDGLTCIEAACPQPYAACCIDFSCWLQTEADCQLNGGTWYIDSPTCSSNPCTLITVDDDGLDFPGADFATIQEAIDFAIDGWEIVVYPGTYTSTGDYVGNLQSMQLNLHGLPGQAEQTIIDGQDVRRGLRLDDSSPGEVRIAHLTITNGYANSTGGSAMYLIGASPLVESVRVTGNVTTEAGSVFMTAGSEPTFRNCLFEDNEAGGGGAIDARTSSSLPSMPTIESCEFRNNHAVQSGGALSSDAFSSFQISDSIFCGNRCDECEEVEGEPHQHITGNWNDLGGNEFSNFCGEIHVDDGSDWPDPDYTTIQAAVDAAGDGDTIIVHRGIYTTSGSSSTPVVFIGNKSITLLGTDGPAETIIDGDGDHVGISCDGTPSSTRIEGFTISDCKAWSTDSSGGGMRLTGSDVEIADCVITGNVASNLSSQGFGGGVFARDSNAIFQNVQFIGNTAGSAGGGIYVKRESLADINPRLINCLFESNEASTGGAILSFQADLLINRCVIRSNTANTAGAIHIYLDAEYPRIRNSVLCGNSLPQLGGVEPQENFNNEISDICTSGACCLDDGTCIDDAAFGAMYDLTCTDLGSTFTAGVTCDDEPCSEPCPADINGDGIVNVSDLLLVIGEWGCSGECPADINDDGTVNVQDLLLVIGEWNCTG